MRTYRIYFNRKAEWPQVWSVDEGAQTSEINVIGFVLHGIHAVSHTRPKEEIETTNHLNNPFAWIEVTGLLRIVGGKAYFYDGSRQTEPVR